MSNQKLLFMAQKQKLKSERSSGNEALMDLFLTSDAGEEEAFCSILWSSFHQPLCCLLLRVAGPALGRAHCVTDPAPSSRTESI